jgi:hypothetical protein
LKIVEINVASQVDEEEKPKRNMLRKWVFTDPKIDSLATARLHINSG